MCCLDLSIKNCKTGLEKYQEQLKQLCGNTFFACPLVILGVRQNCTRVISSTHSLRNELISLVDQQFLLWWMMHCRKMMRFCWDEWCTVEKSVLEQQSLPTSYTNQNFCVNCELCGSFNGHSVKKGFTGTGDIIFLAHYGAESKAWRRPFQESCKCVLRDSWTGSLEIFLIAVWRKLLVLVRLHFLEIKSKYTLNKNSKKNLLLTLVASLST